MIGVLEVKVERDALPSDLELDEVQAVKVQLDGLRVLAELAGSEDDRDLHLVLLSWHEDLSRDDGEVEIVRPLEVCLKEQDLERKSRPMAASRPGP